MRQSHRLQAAPLTAGLSKEGLLSKILSNSNAQSLGEKNQKITPLPHKNTTKSVYDLNSTPGSTLAAMGRGSGGRFYYYYYPTFRGRTGRYRGNEWPPRSQEGERPARFELPPPLPHTHPCTLHQGPPIFVIRTRYCQAPAPAQPRSNTAQPGPRRGTERGLRMRVSRPDASLWTWGATSRTGGRRAPPAQDARPPLPLTREITWEL